MSPLKLSTRISILSIVSHMDSISQSVTKRSQPLDRVAVDEIGRKYISLYLKLLFVLRNHKLVV